MDGRSNTFSGCSKQKAQKYCLLMLSFMREMHSGKWKIRNFLYVRLT